MDPITGLKLQTLSMDGSQKVCPSSSGTTVYIGRTGGLFVEITTGQLVDLGPQATLTIHGYTYSFAEYTIVMFDSKTREKRFVSKNIRCSCVSNIEMFLT